jgi:hypothetical protein
MYRVQAEWENQAKELAYFWHQYSHHQATPELPLQASG